MTNSTHRRGNILALLAIEALSAVTMLWLFWHYPLATGIATVAVLAAFDISARLTRAIDPEGLGELERSNQRARMQGRAERLQNSGA